MGKKVKTWLIIAVSLIVFGVITFVAIMTGYNWDFTKLSTVTYQTNTHDVTQPFDDIFLQTETADVRFVAAEDNTCKVVCVEQENVRHDVLVADGKLRITIVDKREWHQFVGINFNQEKITVYLPESVYNSLVILTDTGDVHIANSFTFRSINVDTSTGKVNNYAAADTIKIKATTGDVRVENVTADTVTLSVSTGKITAKNVTCSGDVKMNVSTGKVTAINVHCTNFLSSGSTGDLSLKNVTATEKFTLQRSTGDILFDGCDAEEIYAKTGTGDVKGTLRSVKKFITKTATGHVNVPNSETGGRCEIITGTGDIRLSVNNG